MSGKEEITKYIDGPITKLVHEVFPDAQVKAVSRDGLILGVEATVRRGANVFASWDMSIPRSRLPAQSKRLAWGLVRHLCEAIIEKSAP